MKTKQIQWAGCSDFKERRQELLKAHEEFLKMKSEGFMLTDAKVSKPKRPRIHRESVAIPKKVKIQAGFLTVTVEFAEWQAHGSIGRIVERYY